MRHKINVVIILNGGWTADPNKTKTGRNLGFTRCDKMAGALVCHAEYVEQPKDIRPALERAAAAVKKGVPSVVNVKTDENATTTFKFTTHMT